LHPHLPNTFHNWRDAGDGGQTPTERIMSCQMILGHLTPKRANACFRSIGTRVSICLKLLPAILGIGAAPSAMSHDGSRRILPSCRRGCANWKSRPPFEFVAPGCAGTGGAIGFPWSKGFDYNPDSVQYAPDFALHAASFGLQEFLKLLQFRD